MSKKYDSLGDRMKGYENIARNYLTRRIPTIIRVDGKAFHTFTRGMEKPFDRILMTTMQNTMKYLCENIQGCVFGYNLLIETARISKHCVLSDTRNAGYEYSVFRNNTTDLLT